MANGVYFTAHVDTKQIWLIIGHIKSNDSIAFHRTIEGANDRMEFLVSEAHKTLFIEYLTAYQKAGAVISYTQEPINLWALTEDPAASRLL